MDYFFIKLKSTHDPYKQNHIIGIKKIQMKNG